MGKHADKRTHVRPGNEVVRVLVESHDSRIGGDKLWKVNSEGISTRCPSRKKKVSTEKNINKVLTRSKPSKVCNLQGTHEKEGNSDQ